MLDRDAHQFCDFVTLGPSLKDVADKCVFMAVCFVLGLLLTEEISVKIILLGLFDAIGDVRCSAVLGLPDFTRSFKWCADGNRHASRLDVLSLLHTVDFIVDMPTELAVDRFAVVERLHLHEAGDGILNQLLRVELGHSSAVLGWTRAFPNDDDGVGSQLFRSLLESAAMGQDAVKVGGLKLRGEEVMLANDFEDSFEEFRDKAKSDRDNWLSQTLNQTYVNHEAKEQRAGETGTALNCLEYFCTPEIAEVFSSDMRDTCSIHDIDKGKILCVDVPEDYTTERKYIFTVMKLLLYRHALCRYSMPSWQRYSLNQLVYVGDEFQTAITASFDGTSDFNVVDRLRDCWLTLIISAQAFESLIPPQTKEQAEVLALNLKNLVMYRAASEADALRCANVLGKRWVERVNRTDHPDHTAYSYQQIEEFRIKPHEFRSLPDHTAVVRHCTNGYKKVCLRPA